MQFDVTRATQVVPSLLHKSPFLCIKTGHKSTRTPTRADQALLPLSSAKASLSRSEFGNKEKGKAREGRWEGGRDQALSHRPPRACYFLSGASARAGEARKELYYHYYSLLARIDEQQ